MDALPRVASQRPYWNSVARDKEFTHPLDAELLGQHLTPASRILDLGCGYGRLTGELLELGYENVLGLDSSTEMVRRGLERAPHLELVTFDGGELPFPDESFDAVVLFSVLTCIPSPQDQGALLDEVSRVSRAEGLVYVSDLLLQDDERNRERYASGWARYGVRGVFDLPEGVVLCHLTPERIEAFAARFERVSFRQLDVRTMNGNAARAFQYLGRRLVSCKVEPDVGEPLPGSSRSPGTARGPESP